MSRGRRSGPGRQGLDDEDAELWDHVARSITPAKRAKGRVIASAEGFDDAPVPVETTVSTATHGSSKTPTPPASRNAAPPAAPPSPAPPSPAAAHARPSLRRTPPPRQPAETGGASLDPHTARRIVSGREEIAARLDLHGMTQSEAHGALVAFLRRCHAKGHRTVLVITGKGAPRLTDPASETWHGGFPHHGAGRERGVLKRNVPHWLETPELSPIVIGYRTAAIAHGGEGAIYVRLRARGR